MDMLTKKEICWMFDCGNLTIRQIARHYNLTDAEVKKILMDDAWGVKQ